MIRSLIQIVRHLVPMFLEDLTAAASRFVAEAAIGSRTDDDSTRERISAKPVHAPQEGLVLPRGEPARKLDAQFVEELRRVDVGKAFKAPANDWPYHAKRLDPGFARLGVDGLRPRCQALDRLATNAARFGGSELKGRVAPPSASAVK